jgi:uncharacterized membrane protein
MSDVMDLEREHGDFDIKAKVVWILYVAAILLGVTSVVGVVFAYIWRADTPDGNLFRKHFDGQIHLFWICLALIIVTILSYFIARFMIIIFISRISVFTIQYFPILFSIIFLGIIAYFVAKSLVGLFKAFGYRPYY